MIFIFKFVLQVRTASLCCMCGEKVMLQCPIFMPEQILSVHDLQKTYGKLEAVRGISFSLEPGEIVGLLGPNGSGKTTTINMILGLLEPSGGEVTIFGKNFREHREEII